MLFLETVTLDCKKNLQLTISYWESIKVTNKLIIVK